MCTTSGKKPLREEVHISLGFPFYLLSIVPVAGAIWSHEMTHSGRKQRDCAGHWESALLCLDCLSQVIFHMREKSIFFSCMHNHFGFFCCVAKSNPN